ncbi:MAG: P-type DNA transfer ATPase VirB11 [Pseudomonadota bacterium]
MIIAASQRLLRPLTPWLEDNSVNEILINRPQEVWTEKSGCMTCHDVPELDADHLRTLFRLIANENHQTLSREQPLLSGNLFDGSRVQLVMPPVSRYPCLSIRRKVMRRVSLEDYCAQKFFSAVKKASLIGKATIDDLSDDDRILYQCYQEGRWAEFIQQAIVSKKNIVISGGTSSGKTTFLNACLQAVEPEARLLILEDTREVDLTHANHLALLATKGEQGEAKVTLQDLVQCCLRLRPDRIVVGEIRGKEILEFLAAAATGHEGSMTSIHANNPQIAFMRMTQMYKLNNVPSMTDEDILHELKTVIDIIVQLEKTAKGRRVQSIYWKYGDL